MTDLRDDLRALGVAKKDVVMAHASMRAVAADVNDLVRALLDVAGTLMAYVDWEMESEDAPFDPASARATRDHGILAETIRAWPGAVRSAHPDAGVACIGERAAWLVADHPFSYGYGEGSPHFSEHAARIPDKRITRHRRRMQSGIVELEELDTCDPVDATLPDAPDLHRSGVEWIERKLR